jgi:alkanesulfonate monooxygenase SsuD/methylene tetrahydromethanopterin reductase-like flavin-dependent oxidoreductase (luciferase family)
MKIGMTLPTMARGYTRDTTVAWCRQIEAGPYASLSAGERITYHNQEQLVILSAAAALTERVRIIATIVILPMHPVALVAKQAATLDVLSAGRFTLGLGVGGRAHDYQAAGTTFDRRLPRLDESVAAIRRLWAGEVPFEGADPVGPAVVQPGGPPLWCSSFGPKSLARGSRWADGYAGFTVGGDRAELETTAATVRQAWLDSGRTVAPYLMGGGWFSLGPDAAERHRAYVEEYVRIDPSMSFMADVATIVGDDAVRRALDNAEAAGYDEFMLVPTTTDLAELDRVEAVLDQR